MEQLEQLKKKVIDLYELKNDPFAIAWQFSHLPQGSKDAPTLLLQLSVLAQKKSLPLPQACSADALISRFEEVREEVEDGYLKAKRLFV